LTLKKALPRLADGRELAAQILPAPETATGTEIILQLRFWDIGAQSLSNSSEIVVSKLATVEQLRLAVASALPRLVDLQDPSQQDVNQLGPESRVDAKDDTTQSNVKLPRLGLAKASAFGPPLDIAGASRWAVSPFLLLHRNSRCPAHCFMFIWYSLWSGTPAQAPHAWSTGLIYAHIRGQSSIYEIMYELIYCPGGSYYKLLRE